MTHSARMVWVAIVFVLQGVTALAQDEDPPLEPVYTDTTPTSLPDLYREAKKMGLPMPPRGALLAAKSHTSRWVFRADFCEGQFQRFDGPLKEPGDHSIPRSIADEFGFLLPNQKGDKKAKFLFGVHFEEDPITDYKVWTNPPGRRELEPFLPSWAPASQNPVLQSESNQMDLVLALQCHAAGHDDLAKLFFERVRARATQPLKKYLHDRAWTIVVERLSNPKVDQKAIFEELRKLDRGAPQWKTRIREDLLRDLESTIRGPGHGKQKNIIDNFLEIDNNSQEPPFFIQGRIFDNINGPIILKDKFRTIDFFNDGLKPISQLLFHINDKRITKFIMTKYEDQLGEKDFKRINEFCFDFLMFFYQHPNQAPIENGESPGLLEFAKFLEEIGQVGEEKYLLDNVFSKQPGADPDPYPPYLWILSRRYPHHLPAIYRKFLTGQSPAQEGLVHDCLLQMDLPPDEKVRLLELGAQAPRPEVAWGALRSLALLDQAAFTRHWLALIDKAIAAKTPDNHPLSTPLGSLADNSDDPKVWQHLRRLLQKADPNLRGRFLNAFMTDPRFPPKSLWVGLYLDFLEDDGLWEEPASPQDLKLVALAQSQVRETVAHLLEMALPGDAIFPETDQPIRASDPRWPEYLKTVRARAQAYLAEP